MARHELHSATRQTRSEGGRTATWGHPIPGAPKAKIALCALLAAFLAAFPAAAGSRHPDQPWIDESLRQQRMEGWGEWRRREAVHSRARTATMRARHRDDNDDDDEFYAVVYIKAPAPVPTDRSNGVHDYAWVVPVGTIAASVGLALLAFAAGRHSRAERRP
jgi:hypothetical protein